MVENECFANNIAFGKCHLYALPLVLNFANHKSWNLGIRPTNSFLCADKDAKNAIQRV
jgi:hypothetical protein